MLPKLIGLLKQAGLSGKDDGQKQGNELGMLISTGLLAGGFASVLYAMQSTSWPQFGSILGVIFMIGSASLLGGGILGFLFGIPRTLQQGQVEKPAGQDQSGQTAASQGQKVAYQQNTNLEQISDWLTKILVGVGLTQVNQISNLLRQYADYSYASLGRFPSSGIFAMALLIFFLIYGFLISYLWTRLYLIKAYVETDLSLIDGKLSTVEGRVSELQKQIELDNKALNLVRQQLDPAYETRKITNDELSSSIIAASPEVKTQIFYQAQNVRRESWKDPENKTRLERTIPVFRALIVCDNLNVYHRNHAQLAYALKDKQPPDWAGAIEELTKAIEIRGDARESGWRMYEFNRAICGINMDRAFITKSQSDKAQAEAILADLKTASMESKLHEEILGNDTIVEWMKINNVEGIEPEDKAWNVSQAAR